VESSEGNRDLAAFICLTYFMSCRVGTYESLETYIILGSILNSAGTLVLWFSFSSGSAVSRRYYRDVRWFETRADPPLWTRSEMFLVRGRTPVGCGRVVGELYYIRFDS